MKRMVSAIAVVMLCCVTALCSVPTPGPEDNWIQPLVSGNNAFALEMYAKLKNGDKELFFSPYSISTAFGMVYAGARGRTAEQIAAAMHYGMPPDRLHPAFQSLAGQLNVKDAPYELSVANALWGKKGYNFLSEFLDLTSKYYGAGLREVDFAANVEAAKTINTWVEDQTKQKIKDLISPDMLDAMTRLVLTNAIYFKGTWASPFEKRWTQDEPFILLDGREVIVPMMQNSEMLRYTENNFMQAVMLPYKGDALSMLVMLPKKAQGLDEVEGQLTTQRLGEWRRNMRLVQVELAIPRFKMTSQFSLNDALKALGMADAFSDNPAVADFSGMNGRTDLYISDAIHKAYVDVNEEGTEAAAATAVVMGLTAMPQEPRKPVVFRADHPFVFFIIDIRNGSILFIGRVTGSQRRE